ncbi:uncharacterized protein LOC130673114 isoform X2 [Microplitis mediator]|uniref:uncharacterized protein LOC130673114 isoform X2 n=1 Tax=Microplitis mediator TaxID=375433 RepID=UPI002553135D|nr:uncharacterized protein LOC130673114 isoform X2 [Microplitis mediator]
MGKRAQRFTFESLRDKFNRHKLLFLKKCRRNHQCCSSSCIASEYSTSKVCGSLYNTDVIITKMTSKPVDAEINQPTKKCVQMGKLCSSHDNCCSKLCAIVKSTRICVMDQNHKDRKPN